MKGTSHAVEIEYKGLNLQAAAGTSMDDMFSATLAAMGKNSQVQLLLADAGWSDVSVMMHGYDILAASRGVRDIGEWM
ncbi:uncharacterized protein ARMOST_01793 [Armillaria ostoyae]|uniref:Uncharacterized protein n=1 Tax=Armillaria ostoyae TaxID=47428 RepID=A0A284QPY6_ARMOS|nr:uncharacterized protein ARMOST_01793 [Armillaria ostoyae]